MSREKALFRWKKPKRVRNAEYRVETAALRPTLRRLLIIIGAVVLVFYGLVRIYLPDVEFPLGDLLAKVIMLCLLFFGLTLVNRFLPAEYCMTDKFIRWNVGSQSRSVHWKFVEQATVQPHPLVSDVQTMKFRLKGNRLVVVTLPEDESAEKICQFVREKVGAFVTAPDFVEPQRPVSLGGNDSMLLLSITVLYVVRRGAFVPVDVVALQHCT